MSCSHPPPTLATSGLLALCRPSCKSEQGRQQRASAGQTAGSISRVHRATAGEFCLVKARKRTTTQPGTHKQAPPVACYRRPALGSRETGQPPVIPTDPTARIRTWSFLRQACRSSGTPESRVVDFDPLARDAATLQTVQGKIEKQVTVVTRARRPASAMTFAPQTDRQSRSRAATGTPRVDIRCACRRTGSRNSRDACVMMWNICHGKGVGIVSRRVRSVAFPRPSDVFAAGGSRMKKRKWHSPSHGRALP